MLGSSSKVNSNTFGNFHDRKFGLFLEQFGYLEAAMISNSLQNPLQVFVAPFIHAVYHTIVLQN